MEERPPAKRRMRSYTVAGLLGIFVAAAALAIVTRVLPGRLSRPMKAPIASEEARESTDDRSR